MVLFENYEVGQKLEVHTQEPIASFEVEVMSKRVNSSARGFTYGVKFVLYEMEKKSSYETLLRFWKDERRSKRKLKFSNV